MGPRDPGLSPAWAFPRSLGPCGLGSPWAPPYPVSAVPSGRPARDGAAPSQGTAAETGHGGAAGWEGGQGPEGRGCCNLLPDKESPGLGEGYKRGQAGSGPGILPSAWRPGAPDLCARVCAAHPKDRPTMHQPLLCCCLLLLCHELHGHRLPPTVPGGGTAGTVKPPGTEVIPLPASPDAPSSHQAAARGLLDSLLGQLPQPGLPRMGVSCHNLLPEALEGFSQLPPLPQTLASAALALSLQGAGCPHHAEGLVLRLYGAVGVDDANALLLGIAGLPGTPRQGGRGRTALLFNVDQLAGPGPRRCSGLAQLDSSLLLGPVTSTHVAFPAAARACHRLGSACAGVASNGTTSFSVIGQPGAYSLPGRGAQAWLHRCRWAGRNRRGSPEACRSERERRVHSVLEWVPVVSTYYNVGTSIYYAFQNCTALAKERGIEAALDLSYDALVVLMGGAGGNVGLGVGIGLKPAIKAGVRSLINYFRQVEPSASPSTSSSSPVTAAGSFVPPSVWV